MAPKVHPSVPCPLATNPHASSDETNKELWAQFKQVKLRVNRALCLLVPTRMTHPNLTGRLVRWLVS